MERHEVAAKTTGDGKRNSKTSVKPQADQQTGRAKKDIVKSTDSRENVMSEGEMNILKYTYKDT